MKNVFLSRLLRPIVISALIPMLSACVHEMPGNEIPHSVNLRFIHDADWNVYDFTVTRDIQPAKTRYFFQLYPAGDTEHLLYQEEVFHSALLCDDFTANISLPPGQYDIWVWSDYADTEADSSLFFNSDSFKNISYRMPYTGSNEQRDAFRGMTSFTVKSSIDYNYSETVDVNMVRPMARYEFISTDLQDFIASEMTRNGRNGELRSESIQLDDYRVRMLYTGYMPNTFNNFIDEPVSAATSMCYDATITRLDNNEARLGFDYVMVKNTESSVKVAMEVYAPDGNLIATINSIDVPICRGQNTLVRGRFLTSKATGGVDIDNRFNGEFNIEIK